MIKFMNFKQIIGCSKTKYISCQFVTNCRTHYVYIYNNILHRMFVINCYDVFPDLQRLLAVP